MTFDNAHGILCFPSLLVNVTLPYLFPVVLFTLGTGVISRDFSSGRSTWPPRVSVASSARTALISRAGLQVPLYAPLAPRT